MIFVTVGTHEQPFNRLLEYIDDMVEKRQIKEDLVVQKGYTDYMPKNYKAEKLLPYEQVQRDIDEARIVITHGGASSFIAVLAAGKIPIVIPREKKFGEHVNDHQLEFAKEVEKRRKNIIVVRTEEELADAILNYDKKIEKLNTDGQSNNAKFVEGLEKEIKDLFARKGKA